VFFHPGDLRFHPLALPFKVCYPARKFRHGINSRGLLNKLAIDIKIICLTPQPLTLGSHRINLGPAFDNLFFKIIEACDRVIAEDSECYRDLGRK
jgi:hypothetical protein